MDIPSYVYQQVRDLFMALLLDILIYVAYMYILVISSSFSSFPFFSLFFGGISEPSPKAEVHSYFLKQHIFISSSLLRTLWYPPLLPLLSDGYPRTITSSRSVVFIFPVAAKSDERRGCRSYITDYSQEYRQRVFLCFFIFWDSSFIWEKKKSWFIYFSPWGMIFLMHSRFDVYVCVSFFRSSSGDRRGVIIFCVCETWNERASESASAAGPPDTGPGKSLTKTRHTKIFSRPTLVSITQILVPSFFRLIFPPAHYN